MQRPSVPLVTYSVFSFISSCIKNLNLFAHWFYFAYSQMEAPEIDRRAGCLCSTRGHRYYGAAIDYICESSCAPSCCRWGICDASTLWLFSAYLVCRCYFSFANVSIRNVLLNHLASECHLFYVPQDRVRKSLIKYLSTSYQLPHTALLE